MLILCFQEHSITDQINKNSAVFMLYPFLENNIMINSRLTIFNLIYSEHVSETSFPFLDFSLKIIHSTGRFRFRAPARTL